jgi:hypothetical protein
MNWDRTAIPGRATSSLSSAMSRWVEPFAGAVSVPAARATGVGRLASAAGGGQRAAMLRIAVVTASVRFDTPSLR